MSENQKIIDQNQILIAYLKTHNLTENEMRELEHTMDIFFLKVLSSSEVYDKVMQDSSPQDRPQTAIVLKF